jgi:hypothetical protein
MSAGDLLVGAGYAATTMTLILGCIYRYSNEFKKKRGIGHMREIPVKRYTHMLNARHVVACGPEGILFTV